MLSELALKIAEVVDLAKETSASSHVWRGLLGTEEWKIMVTSEDATYNQFTIIVKNRTPSVEA